MQIAIAILPLVNAYPHMRLSQCPCRRCSILHRRGESRKRVKDAYTAEVAAMRYRCVT